MVELSASETKQSDVGRVAQLDEPQRADSSDGVFEAEYFTDPLCCWSWAFEPQRQRLAAQFGSRIAWRVRMGGMIAGWDRYQDPVNCIGRPLQMAPLWFQVRHTTGAPVDDGIWFTDPPESSYPSCIAVKASELQSPDAGAAYLHRLREAVMCRRRNIAKRDVLLAIAAELGEESPEVFDAHQLERDLDSQHACDLFREDVQLARYLEIGRFPTLILHRASSRTGIAIVGYRPFSVLEAAMKELDAQSHCKAE